MGKRGGPNADQRAEGFASAMAIALGKFSDEKWREGPWFMELTLVTRKFADALVAGEFHAPIVAMVHAMPWTEPPTPGENHVVAPAWEYPKTVNPFPPTKIGEEVVLPRLAPVVEALDLEPIENRMSRPHGAGWDVDAAEDIRALLAEVARLKEGQP